MTMVYKWRPGFHAPKIPAQVVGEEIESIRERSGGSVTADLVLAEAADENHRLHDAFEWDDAKAAHAHRLTQAGEMIRSIVVTVDAKPDAGPVRAFVSVVDPEPHAGRVFTSVQHAMSRPDLREQVLRQAKQEMLSWRKRYAQYQELASVFDVIDGVIGQHDKAA